VELRDALSAKFGVDMPPTLTFDHPTITAIAAYIVESLQPSVHMADQVDSASKHL
jgi:acyl carrier protein